MFHCIQRSRGLRSFKPFFSTGWCPHVEPPARATEIQQKITKKEEETETATTWTTQRTTRE